MAGVVGVAGEDGEGAVKLLGEDGAGQFMRQGDGAEREDEAGAQAGGVSPAVVGADSENDGLGAGVAQPAEVFGEGFARELLAAGVQQDEDRSGAGGGAVERGEQVGLGGVGLGVCGGVAGGPGEVVGGEGGGGVGFGAGAGWVDGGESEPHGLRVQGVGGEILLAGGAEAGERKA
jgi:hypothetical protein